MDGLPQSPVDTSIPQPRAPQAPPRVPFPNRRGFRLALGLGVMALAALVLIPRLVSYAADDAIVQARTALLQTPIEGTVADVAVPPGQTVARGMPIVTIANARIDRSFLNELLTERNFLTRRVADLDQQALGLVDLQQQLGERTAAVREGAIRLLAKEIAARQAELAAARAQLAASELEMARQAQLKDKGHASSRALEGARAQRDSLAARAVELERRIDLLAEEQAQARRGIFISEGRFGETYSETRRDEIAITLLDIYSRRAQEESRIEQIERQIDAENTRLERAGTAEIRAPFDGVVWKVLTQAGSEVVIGAEVAQVLDCSAPILEILVSESRFERISVGEKIRYRFIGSQTFRSGRVTALRGGTVHAEDRTFAADLARSHNRSFRVWADLDSADRAASGEAFCNVGRHVDVRFDQNIDLLSAVRGLWSAL